MKLQCYIVSCDGRDKIQICWSLLRTFVTFGHFCALWAFLCTLGTSGKRRQRFQQSFAFSFAEDKLCSRSSPWMLENRKMKKCFHNQTETNSVPLSHTWIYYDIATLREISAAVKYPLLPLVSSYYRNFRSKSIVI